jgi:hypothetical protein
VKYKFEKNNCTFFQTDVVFEESAGQRVEQQILQIVKTLWCTEASNCKSEVSDIYVKNELLVWAQSRNNKLSDCDIFSRTFEVKHPFMAILE